MNRLVVKLLFRHLSWGQLLGFFGANLFGLAIVLLSWQFYVDVSPVFTQGDSFMKPSYLVVGKRVTAVQTFMGDRPDFTERELSNLAAQPFVVGMGRFVPAQFDVFAAIGSRELGLGMSTEMFFEAIPDEYIDVDLRRWHYVPGSDSLPLILPRSYLNLYNFGFASSRGLPALSESLIGMVELQFRLRGQKGERQMHGKVIGFSNRLNTILVPWNFMEEANATLSPQRKPACSRLLLKVNDSASEELATYLAAHHYEEEGHGADSGRMTFFLRLVVGLVLGVGLVICALAFYVLLLSIYLLLQKHTEKIDTLLIIGYSPQSVALPFHLLSILLNLVALLLSWGAVCLVRTYYTAQIGEIYPQLEPGSTGASLGLGFLIYLFVTGLNFWAVHRKIRRIWFMHSAS